MHSYHSVQKTAQNIETVESIVCSPRGSLKIFTQIAGEVISATHPQIVFHIFKYLEISWRLVLQKNKRQISSNIPCKFGHFWRKFNFLAPKTSLLDARSAETRYVIWSFTSNFIFSPLRIFYVKSPPPTSGGGGVSAHP